MLNADDVKTISYCQFEIFLNSLHKEDLLLAYKAREKVKNEIVEYNELKHTIELLKTPGIQANGLQSAVNIGRDFFVDAYVGDVSKIVVNIGADLFVECTLDEALVFISKKQQLLEDQIEYLSNRIAEIGGLVTHYMSTKSVSAITADVVQPNGPPTAAVPDIPVVGIASRESEQLIEAIQTLLSLNLLI